MPTKDIADRYTILKLKCEHGLDCYDEMKLCKNKLASVPEELIIELFEVNSMMWEIENRAEEYKSMNPLPLSRLGKLFLRQRHLNKIRIAIKNSIAEAIGEAREQKKFA